MTAIKRNTVHHMDNREGMAALPEKCASLIIADPPYFEVKGEFDFIWKSFGEYLEFMEEQAKAYKRILAENGTLYVYGHAKKIAYVQVIFDKYFHLENNITVHIFDRQTNKGIALFRCFAPVTERLLMYSSGNDFVEGDCPPQSTPFSREIRKGMLIHKLTEGDFRKLRPSRNGNLTGWCSNIILGVCNPTKSDWELIETIIKSGREYEELSRQFENYLKLTDVMRFSQEAYLTKKYDHDTVKPSKLSQALIITSSRKGDLIVVPFAGSGSECVAAKKKGREFIGFDTTLKYVEMANERVRLETRQKEMF